MISPHIDRHQITVQQHPSQAEADRAQQADPPVQIQDKLTVVPPSHAPPPLQEHAGRIFHYRADCRRQQEGQKLSLMQPVKQEPQQKPPCTINGQIGAKVYPSVDPGMLCHQVNRHFPQPAGKGDEEKVKHIKVKIPYRKKKSAVFCLHGISLPAKDMLYTPVSYFLFSLMAVCRLVNKSL